MLFVRPFVAFVIAVAASHSSAQDGCIPPPSPSTTRAYVECLFFSGTQHFRGKEYPRALALWQQLAELPEMSAELEAYRLDAYNNVGFLLYMGWGTAPQRQKSLQLWQSAYKAGHAEATYHLCHFYGEPAEPEYEPALALRYCREALLRYKKLGDRPGQSEAVVKQLELYVSRLESR